MTAPIDTAYVLIEPKFDRFESDARRKLDVTFEHIDDAVKDLVHNIERMIEDLANEMHREFGDMRENMDMAFEHMAASSERAAEALTQDMNRAARDMSRDFDRAGAQVKRDLDEAGSQGGHALERHLSESRSSIASNFDSWLSSFGSKLKAGLLAVGIGATAGLGFLGKLGLETAASWEQTQIAFNSLTGSVQKGTEVFNELKQFAAATPFELSDILPSAKRFLAFDDAVGISDKQLQNFLTTIGNLVSITGGSGDSLNSISLAFGQIASQGKLTLDNLNQINDALPGFSSVAVLAKVRGESTAKVMQEISNGTISAKDGVAELLKGMKQFPGAAGAMDAQSKTLAGVWSTFKDTVSNSLVQAFQPLLPTIEKIVLWAGEKIPQVIDKLVGFGKKVEGIFKGTALGADLQELTSRIQPMKGFVENAKKEFERLFNTIKDHKVELKQLAEMIVTFGEEVFKYAPKVIGLFSDIIVVVSKIIDVINWMARTFTRTMADIIGAAASAFGWVPGLGPKLKEAAKQADEFADKVNTALDRIKNDVPINLDFHSHIGAPNSGTAGGRIHGAYAKGGQTPTNEWFLVGEKGPEWMNRSGYVDPTGRLALNDILNASGPRFRSNATATVPQIDVGGITVVINGDVSAAKARDIGQNVGQGLIKELTDWAFVEYRQPRRV